MEEKLMHIADKLLSLTPMIRKRINRPDNSEKRIINHTHYLIMINLKNEGKLSVSEIGRRMVISKPNMTPLIDKLIKVGFVKRIPDERDRRIVNIVLTAEGMEFLDKRRKENLVRMERKLRSLMPEDLENLSYALDILHHTLTKIQEDDVIKDG